jgi:hypothetical protein
MSEEEFECLYKNKEGCNYPAGNGSASTSTREIATGSCGNLPHVSAVIEKPDRAKSCCSALMKSGSAPSTKTA